MGYRVTAANTTAVVAWALAEGGGWGHAANNPLNTTRSAEGSTKYNKIGVRNYRSCEQGLAKTVETLQLKPYADIREALRTSADPSVLANANGLATWGTGHVRGDLIKQARKSVN